MYRLKLLTTRSGSSRKAKVPLPPQLLAAFGIVSSGVSYYACESSAAAAAASVDEEDGDLPMTQEHDEEVGNNFSSSSPTAVLGVGGRSLSFSWAPPIYTQCHELLQDGSNRRRRAVLAVVPAGKTSDEYYYDGIPIPQAANAVATAAATSDASHEESSSAEGEDGVAAEEQKSAVMKSSAPAPNSLLAQLAQERMERHEQLPSKGSNTNVSNSNGKKKRKGKGQKLGGAKPAPKQEDNFDDLDDMAFLDAQIEKAQNAHGRKVAGSGKQYKTIVNGILNSRPEPRSKPKNERAGAALHAKLKDAETSRKKKNAKKWKRMTNC